MSGRRTITIAPVLALLIAAPAAAPAELRMPEPTYPKIASRPDVPIPVDEQVTLYGDLHLPAGADGRPAAGRFPTVLVQTPYNKNRAHGSSADPQSLKSPQELFVRHGYAVLLVDVRGTGSSQGSWNPLSPAEQRDSERVASWLRSQPWSDGTFGTYGMSYLAWNQFHLAARRPPGLKAAFAIAGGEDAYRDVTFHGGAANAAFMPYWLGLVNFMKILPPNYGLTDQEAAWKLFLDRVGGGAQYPIESTVSAGSGGEFAYDGPYYRERSTGETAHRIEIPTFVVGGWWDLFVRGQGRLYERIATGPGRKQLLMGPWFHAGSSGRIPGTGGGFGDGLGRPGAPPGLDVLAVAWMDRWLRGRRNGVERMGPVTLQQAGIGRWETLPAWPRDELRYERWYLRPERSGSARSLNDGSLAPDPPATAARDSGQFNPFGVLCSRGMTQWTTGTYPPGTPCESDHRTREQTAFTYTTAPLREPLHLSGPLGLRLTGSTTAHDATWVATLTDVHPDGRSEELTNGWLVMSHRALDEQRTERARNGDAVVPWHPHTRESELRVQPGRAEALDIEILTVNAVIRPRHRLRLVISSGDAGHLGQSLPIATRSIGSSVSVHHDPAAPGRLTVPVVRPELATVRLAAAARRLTRGGSLRLDVACPEREADCPVVLRAGGGPTRSVTVPAGTSRVVAVRVSRRVRRRASRRGSAGVIAEATLLSAGRRVAVARWSGRARTACPRRGCRRGRSRP